jgi:hypothetical protein
MPYIIWHDRLKYDAAIDKLIDSLAGINHDHPPEPGDLNYCLSRIIWYLWEISPCYSTGAEIIGALECVKQEFYRRQVAPHEDEACRRNGDLEPEAGGGGQWLTTDS